MRRTPAFTLLVLVLVALALVLAACGGGGSSAPSTAATTTTAPAATAATAPPAPTSAAPEPSAPAGATTTTTAGGASPAAMAEAEQIFTMRCTLCHGPEGKGDGPGAASLNPKPRNYQDAAWQATVTDQEIERTILLGGAAVGKSPLMPPNSDLANKPDVVAALRMKVRSFAQPAAAP